MNRLSIGQLSILCFVATAFSCATDTKENGESTKPASTDVAALARRVKLGELPQEAVFKISPMGKGDGIFGPSDYSLIAALRYEPAALARVKLQLTRQNLGQSTAWLPERPEWFPESLSSRIQRCPNGWCIEGEEYSARPFLKSGFVTGTFVTPHDSDFVILLLRT